MKLTQTAEVATFSEAIKIARKTAQLTIEQLSRQSGVSTATIHNVESEKHDPICKTIFALVQSIGLHMDFKLKNGDRLIPFDGKNFGRVVNYLRNEMEDGAGWTLKKLSEESTISPGSLSNLERNNSGRLSSLKKALEAMDAYIFINVKHDKNG